jgi:neutral ceramidase
LTEDAGKQNSNAMIKFFLLIGIVSIFSRDSCDAFDRTTLLGAGWKAGVAKVVITPETSMWMAGYAARKRPSEGTLHELWAKALAVEDAEGERLVFISTDLAGIPKAISERIRNRLNKSYGLSRAQIVLNSSHTHTGPALLDPVRAYQIPQDQLDKVTAYSGKLEDNIVSLVGEALKAMQPVQLYAENGVTRFQVNRRNNNEFTLAGQAELKGPNDYAVPVIKVENKSGDLIAIAFGYACHPTVLNGYEWSGDYVGFAQIELEKKYPNATALFFQGAGADQNPLPRRSVALAQQYGETLAAAVQRVLTEQMRELSPQLATAYSEVQIPFSTPPTQQVLSSVVSAESSSALEKQWAAGLLAKIKNGESLMTSYPYPVQALRLGGQLIFTLGGEVVVEYAIELKRIFGKDIIVFGYSNDPNVAYIPSTTILREGGYEGATSQLSKGLPGPWAPDIETIILTEALKLAAEVGVKPGEQ